MRYLLLLASMLSATLTMADPPPAQGDPYEWQPTFSLGCWVAAAGVGVKQCERVHQYYFSYSGMHFCGFDCDPATNKCSTVPSMKSTEAGPDMATVTPSVRAAGTQPGDGPGNQARWRMLKCYKRQDCVCNDVDGVSMCEPVPLTEIYTSAMTSYHFDLGGPACETPPYPGDPSGGGSGSGGSSSGSGGGSSSGSGSSSGGSSGSSGSGGSSSGSGSGSSSGGSSGSSGGYYGGSYGSGGGNP